jgi:hypothetical protein
VVPPARQQSQPRQRLRDETGQCAGLNAPIRKQANTVVPGARIVVSSHIAEAGLRGKVDRCLL